MFNTLQYSTKLVCPLATPKCIVKPVEAGKRQYMHCGNCGRQTKSWQHCN